VSIALAGEMSATWPSMIASIAALLIRDAAQFPPTVNEELREIRINEEPLVPEAIRTVAGAKPVRSAPDM